MRLNIHPVDINTKVPCTLQTYKEFKQGNPEKKDNSPIFKSEGNSYG